MGGLKLLVVGDSFMPTDAFRQVFDSLLAAHDVNYLQIDATKPFVPASEADTRLREFEGTPVEIAEHMEGVEVLVVHGAPVTTAVVSASGVLALVGCARGGPVNVDIEALTACGIPLVHTPGKNAEAVADLTLAFMVMLARGMPSAQRFLAEGNRLIDNFQGSRFVGSDLRRHVLGLVGYGRVGQRVATRAISFGMGVLVYDPFVSAGGEDGVEQVATLDELLRRSDFVSLHARATSQNTNLIDAAAFELIGPRSFLINTARESLVNEDALDHALESGRLAGAALDVVQPTSGDGAHPLLRHENVVMTPHIGGATHETLAQGAEMLAEEILRFAAGQPLMNVVNGVTVAA